MVGLRGGVGNRRRILGMKTLPDGELLGRIPLPLENKSGNSFVLMTPKGPAWYFTVSTRHAWSPLGHVVVGRNDEYSIRLLRPDSTVTSIGRDVPPVPVDPQEREMWRDWAAYMGRRSGGGYPALPELKPYFKDIYIGEDGRIWAHRHVATEWHALPPRVPGGRSPLAVVARACDVRCLRTGRHVSGYGRSAEEFKNGRSQRPRPVGYCNG